MRNWGPVRAREAMLREKDANTPTPPDKIVVFEGCSLVIDTLKGDICVLLSTGQTIFHVNELPPIPAAKDFVPTLEVSAGLCRCNWGPAHEQRKKRDADTT